MTTQAAHPDLPLPKHRVGQTVFRYVILEDFVNQECPDCLGSTKWKITTPRGEEFEISCLRCSVRYSDVQLPRLKKWIVSIEPLTIGSIRIDTSHGSGWNKDRSPVEYMGTGGSCSIFSEDDLYSSNEEAVAAAELECKKLQENTDSLKSTKELMQFRDISILHLQDEQLKKKERELRYDVENFIEKLLYEVEWNNFNTEQVDLLRKAFTDNKSLEHHFNNWAEEHSLEPA